MTFSNALVTGGTGFIGKALCSRLIQAGVKPTLLMREGRQEPEGCSVIKAASLEKDALNRLLAGHQYDVVFHLAAYGVAPRNRDPLVTFETNVAGTNAVIHAAATVSARAFVYVGSCSEYREPSPGTLISEDAPLAQVGLYGASKAAAGVWGQALASHLQIPFQWMRLFNVFGPGEAEHRLIPSIMRSMSRDEPVALSPGEQVRDFLHVDDVVQGLMLAANAALAKRTGPFNLCSGQPISIKQVALTLAEALGKPKSLLNFGALSYRPDECPWLVGRPDRFERITGFRPQVSLAEGIEATIAAAVKIR